MTHAPQILEREPPRTGLEDLRSAREAATSEVARAREATHAEWLSLDTLARSIVQWQDLAARALEPNIFYEPGFALPAGEAFGKGLGAVAIWDTAERDRLIGLFPGRIARRRFGLGPSVFVGWTHTYAPLGTPLVDREHGAEAIAAWLDFLANGPGMPRLALLPYMTLDGPVAALFRQAIKARGGRDTYFGRHARALLAPSRDRADYLERALSSKKRKELRRQRRLLDADGHLTVAAKPRNADLDDFFALERNGWKGRSGTAASQDAVVEQFMREAITALGQRGQAHAIELVSGDRAVAAGIVLRSGDRAWFWKIAYDEAEARASPGVQLTVDLTRTFLDDLSLTVVDSCATSDHAMIDHIWRERLDIADLLLATDARAAGAFVVAQTLERARRSMISAAKMVRGRLRRR